MLLNRRQQLVVASEREGALAAGRKPPGRLDTIRTHDRDEALGGFAGQLLTAATEHGGFAHYRQEPP